MAENKYVVNPDRMPVFMAAGGGSGGDLIYLSTGSGTHAAGAIQFAGVLDTTTVAGSYGVVETRGVFEYTKGDGTGVKLEQGQVLFGSDSTSVATAKVTDGSAVGVAWQQSSSDTTKVEVFIHGMIPKAH